MNDPREFSPLAWTRIVALAVISGASLAACGGGGGGGSGPGQQTMVPGAPGALVATTGDAALSLGWTAPASTGGAAIQSYEITSTPAVAAANISVAGTHAVITGLTNDTPYTLTVRARNSAGLGAASSSVTVTPRRVDVNIYTPLVVQGDASPSGIYDPSLLRVPSGDLWLSYSSVDYHNNGSGQLVQDVGVRLARSADGGMTFNFVQALAAPAAGTVTDTDIVGQSACGAATCTGRWNHETSWLIDDATDPDPARRYKWFAHKYFLNPGGASPTLYHLGAIVMRTAGDPAGTWSAETTLLRWNLTPPEFTGGININTLHADLAPCLVVAEGGAAVRGGTIDLVFACPFLGANPNPQKVVMLRSSDHLATLQYVSTLLTTADAAPYGNANFFTAPALLASAGNAQQLIVTPAIQGIYVGSVVFPFADEAAGTLIRRNGAPVPIAFTPVPPGHFGGAATYELGAAATGLLLSDGTAGATLLQTQFRITATHAALQ